MPAPDFSIKAGDTGASLPATLENSGGTAVNIQSATILLKVGPFRGGTLTMLGAGTIDQVGDGSGGTSGLLGKVHYKWPTTGFATADLYRGEWEVTFSSGTIQTFPNDSYFSILVTDDL
jgi:hypothetical protein